MKAVDGVRKTANALGGVVLAGISAYLFAIVFGLLWWAVSELVERPAGGIASRNLRFAGGMQVLLLRFPETVIAFSWWFFVPAGALVGIYVGGRLSQYSPRDLALRAGTAVGLPAAAFMVIRSVVVPSLQPGVTGGSVSGLVSSSLLMFVGYSVLFVAFCVLCVWVYIRVANRAAAHA